MTGQRPERPDDGPVPGVGPAPRLRPGSGADHRGSTSAADGRGDRPGDPEAVLPAREQAALDAAVGPVGGSRRGATLTAGLVVLAFVIGVLRPWDWLGGTTAVTASLGPGASGAVAVPDSGGQGGSAGSPAPSPTPAPGSDAAAAQTCAYPQSWRSATIQEWAGRAARVWTAVDATVAGGPLDPSIPFQVIAGDRFSALGWCAPVLGPDRPPEAAVGRLFRLAAGVATEPPFRLLEPAAPNALGELWVPAAATAVGTVTWPPGRYVIELATPSGSWTRWIGIELRVTPQPAVSAVPSGSPAAPPSRAAPSPSG